MHTAQHRSKESFGKLKLVRFFETIILIRMATSLLELASRIQSMELSCTTILMETAMKLASLTDANVFMVVDTQEGRR